jgi:hypothetical protein
MDRQDRIVEITPELLRYLRRAQLAAAVIFVGFFTLFVVFAPRADQNAAQGPAVVQASR